MLKKYLNILGIDFNSFLVTLGFFIIAQAIDSSALFIIVILLVINKIKFI